MAGSNHLTSTDLSLSSQLDIVDLVSREVKELQQKNRTDELAIEGLRDLVINVKEQLDTSIDNNRSKISRTTVDNLDQLNKECEG